MPEYLRALIVILVLSTVVFAFAKAPACALAMAPKDFERRRNLWFGIVFAGFLAHNFWIYNIVAVALLFFAFPREQNKLAMFFFLLFAMPPIPAQITGFGVINYLFTIDYIRLLTLVILLPAFFSLQKQPNVERFGRSIPDKLLACYIVLLFLLDLRVDTFTNALRRGAFYPFIDIFLPYYVASRSLKNLEEFRDALMGFAVAALVLSAIGVFEFAKHWLLYAPLNTVFGNWAWGLNYLERGVGSGLLRAQATTGHPIALGYVIAVATGFFLYLRRSVPNSTLWNLGFALLILGLIAPISRGPWVGAATMLLIFVATGPSLGRTLAILGMLSVVILPVLLATPAGETIRHYMPFIGTVEEQNVTQRQELLEVSIETIKQNPLFGTPYYLASNAMQELRHAGMIDVVNTFLGIGLSYGLVGLSLFSGFFVAVGVGIFKSMRKLVNRSDEHYLLGQVLFSALLAIVIIIATVSSISFIPVVYWSVAGLGVGYVRMLASKKGDFSPELAKSRPMTEERTRARTTPAR